MRKNYLFLLAALCVAFFSNCEKQQSPQNTSTDRQTLDKIAQSYGYKPYSGPITPTIQQLKSISIDEFVAEMAKGSVENSSKGQKTIEGGPVTNGTPTYTYTDGGDSLNPFGYYENTGISGLRFPNLEALHIPSIFTFGWAAAQYGNGGNYTPPRVSAPTIYGDNLQASWSFTPGLHQYVADISNVSYLHFTGQMVSYLNISGTVYTAGYLYDCSINIAIAGNNNYLAVQGGIGLTQE